ncbi:Hypothetical protein KLENKIAIHU_2753 [Klenkia terrae]|nr:Hypothetical protein KLENKIAIHU_2753 [Klenkia terrae]
MSPMPVGAPGCTRLGVISTSNPTSWSATWSCCARAATCCGGRGSTSGGPTAAAAPRLRDTYDRGDGGGGAALRRRARDGAPDAPVPLVGVRQRAAANPLLVAFGIHTSAGGTSAGFPAGMTTRRNANAAVAGSVIADEVRATPASPAPRPTRSRPAPAPCWPPAWCWSLRDPLVAASYSTAAAGGSRSWSGFGCSTCRRRSARWMAALTMTARLTAKAIHANTQTTTALTHGNYQLTLRPCATRGQVVPTSGRRRLARGDGGQSRIRQARLARDEPLPEPRGAAEQNRLWPALTSSGRIRND